MSESLNQQIDRLQEVYKSELDPQGRAFVPLADAHRQLGDLSTALAVIQEGLESHPDFASAHMVAGWVHRSRQEPDDAMRSFERVLALDAENALARAAIAELIDDQRAQTYRDKMAAKGAAAEGDESPVVPITSLAPGAPDEVGDARPVVSIASLAPGAPADAAVAPDAVADHDRRPVVSIASLAPAPGTPDETHDVPDASLGPLSNSDARSVVPVASLAPDRDVAPDLESAPDLDPAPDQELAPVQDDDAPYDATPGGGEIYTQTLAELYAVQGATDEAIEVYRKLIAQDPDNEILNKRLTELESLEPGSEMGAVERQIVPIEALAPDGGTGDDETPNDPFPSLNRL